MEEFHVFSKIKPFFFIIFLIQLGVIHLLYFSCLICLGTSNSTNNDQYYFRLHVIDPRTMIPFGDELFGHCETYYTLGLT